MKFIYDPDLAYQKQAVQSVVDLFKGFRPDERFGQFSMPQSVIDNIERSGYGNNLMGISNEQLLANLRDVQTRNDIAMSDKLGNHLEYDIEMETGTGKTYVYLRTIYALHKAYGLSKFVILVPTRPIRAGVTKTIQTTRDHFKTDVEESKGVLCDFLVYHDETKAKTGKPNAEMGKVRTFIQNGHLSVLVMTVQSINSANNTLCKPQESFNGCKPIELLARTQPVVIVDEPQRVLGKDDNSASQQAVYALNPAFVLHYSATHVKKHHLVYQLGPVESYQQRLVKEIEVVGFKLNHTPNQGFLNLISTDIDKRTASIGCYELDSKQKARQVNVTLKQNDDLEQRTGNSVYHDLVVENISFKNGDEYVSFANGTVLRKGCPFKDISDYLVRLQIRRTIQEHLQKESILMPLGIKVLSLFFIDEVAKYREEDGGRNGIYANIFEEEYKNVIHNIDCLETHTRYWKDHELKTFHNGYFAKDKKSGKNINSTWSEKTTGKSKDYSEEDAAAIQMILNDKEKLLDLKTPLRFIFSHSALQEGWDNPNIFQICTLADNKSETSKRQRIGRGMRLAVNKRGERVHEDSVNILTVIANESYESFAEKLQKDYENDTGIKFGRITKDILSMISKAVYIDESGQRHELGEDGTKRVTNYLIKEKYIDSDGTIRPKLREAIRRRSLTLPDEFAPYSDFIAAKIGLACGVEPRNADTRHTVAANKNVKSSTEFRALWNRIKQKTCWRVKFDSQDFVKKCANELSIVLDGIPELKAEVSKAGLDITHSGIRATQKGKTKGEVIHDFAAQKYPDIISEIENETHLKRKTIVDALVQSKTLSGFLTFPQLYISKSLEVFKNVLSSYEIDNIDYFILDGEFMDDAEFFKERCFHETQQSVKRDKSSKSLFNWIDCDSDIEKQLADHFEDWERVKMYAKLPETFVISTPIGTYNPDWAVVCACDNQPDRMYFVFESKGTTLSRDLRPEEREKITCGKKHFNAINVEYFFGDVEKAKDMLM